MKLTELTPAKGQKKKHKRVGRGNGSGKGTTAGKGSKGQKARSGYKAKPWFEGGQMPLQRRVPKRGFKNLFQTRYAVVNVGRLNDLEDGTEVTPEYLRERDIVQGKRQPVKLLSDGTLDRKLTIRLHAASAKALEKVQAAGGTFEKIQYAAAAGKSE